MLSIQEMVEKANWRQVRDQMDHTGGFYPYSEKKDEQGASILNTEKPADYWLLKEALHTIPLREFLAKSGTTGIMGAAYLVPDKIHDVLITAAAENDLVPLISASVVNGWEGGDLKVNVLARDLYKAPVTKGGGESPYVGMATTQATLKPVTFTRNIGVTDDLLESAAYDLAEYFVRQASAELTDYSNELALTALKTATDGVGTVVGGASGDADETKWTGATTFGVDDDTEAKSLVKLLTDQRYIANTMIVTTEAWEHSILKTFVNYGVEVAGGAAGDYYTPYSPLPTLQTPAVSAGFDAKIGAPALDIKFCNNAALHAAYPTDSTAMTNCVTIVFDKRYALLTGRKRWMRLEEYSDPVADLAGAVVSCRQDSCTLHNNAVGVITET